MIFLPGPQKSSFPSQFLFLPVFIGADFFRKKIFRLKIEIPPPPCISWTFTVRCLMSISSFRLFLLFFWKKSGKRPSKRHEKPHIAIHFPNIFSIHRNQCSPWAHTSPFPAQFNFFLFLSGRFLGKQRFPVWKLRQSPKNWIFTCSFLIVIFLIVNFLIVIFLLWFFLLWFFFIVIFFIVIFLLWFFLLWFFLLWFFFLCFFSCDCLSHFPSFRVCVFPTGSLWRSRWNDFWPSGIRSNISLSATAGAVS